MSRRILVADDSLTIQKVVELILKPEGFEILALSDGEQAWQAVATFAPEIVLADVDMPSLTGYELCARIRQDRATAHIPVILLAGAFEPFDEARARSVSASSVIVKPFETRELLGKVEHLLSDRARAEGAAAEPAMAGAAPGEVHEGVAVSGFFAGSASASGEGTSTASASLAEGALPAGVGRAEALSNQAEAARGAIDERISAFIRAELAPGLSEHLRDQVSRSVASVTPSVVGTIAREIITDVSASLKRDLEGMMREMLQTLMSQLKESIGASISAGLPEVLDNASRQLIGEVIAGARPEIEGSLKRIVPEVAERLIQKEIEKITADL